MNRKIIIYRDSILPVSETFVKEQTESYQHFQPYYVGTKRVENGINLPPENVIVHFKKNNIVKKIIEISYKKLGYSPYLLNKLKKINPLLIHAHFGPDGVIALPYAKKLNIPLVVTFHGFDATVKDEDLFQQAFNSRHYAANYRKLFDANTTFIAVSNFIKQKLIEKGFPEEKIITHYIGINHNLLKPDPTIERENIVLFVGRLVENKGCEYLIKAMEIVQKDNPDTKLVIIGDGPLKKELEIEATKTLKNPLFLGKQPYSEVIKWLNKAKVFSVPSIEIGSGASEGFGMVFLEASAMGVPAASFSTGGIPEAVEHNKTGLLAGPGNIKELATNIHTLLNNELMWKEFSENAIKRTLTDFDISKQTHQLENIFLEILSKDSKL